jgi:hypothetical protein
MPAKTTAQVIVDYSTNELDAPSVASFEKFRKMRRDPTIGLVRKYSVAPTLASTWSFEGEDEDQVALVKQILEPMRTHLLRTALFAERDFGWKAYEKVFAIRDVTFPSGMIDKSQVLDQVKPLKNDITRVRYEKESGRFMGLATENIYTGEKILIDADHSLFVNFDDEGLGNYAEGHMQRVEAVYDRWNNADDAAARYDEKMAGTYLVVYHPVGQTMFDGVLTDNGEIAKKIIQALRGSGSVSIPVELADIAEKATAGQSGWKIEFLTPAAMQGSFVEREKYLDANKARAFEVPERAVLEGEFGTKAEAGIHASAALLNMHLEHVYLVEFFNWHVVNQLTLLNWGVENTVRIKANELTDAQKSAFIMLLEKLLADPAAGPDIADKIDTEALLDAAGIPMRALDDGEVPAEAEVAADPAERNGAAQPAADAFRSNGKPSRVSVTVG